MDKHYDQIIKIDKGYSHDEKFQVKIDSKDFLLRVSPLKAFGRSNSIFGFLEKINQLEIPTYKPIKISKYQNQVHSLFEWINGHDLIDVIGHYSEKERYQFGLDAGKYLRKMHTIDAPIDIEPWDVRFNRKIDRNIKRYLESPLDIPETSYFIKYLESHRHLLNNRPQTFQHGDYHIGNMMVNRQGELIVIDYDRFDFGDPFEEFNRIVWSAEQSPAFANGYINGYFDNDVPDEFWSLMLLYISSNVMSSLTWALAINEEEVKSMISQMHRVLQWYDAFKLVKPNWYIEKL
ncbi:MAG: aminoglycoside phosphotransferase family protein [Candidatus Izemoplasmataceae bacterium]